MFVLAAKIVMAWNTYGTNDAMTFEADLRTLDSAGPRGLYREGARLSPNNRQAFSHSPPVIHLLLLMRRLERSTGLPVRFWMRVCCAFADLASIWLLWKLGVRSRATLLLTVLSPVSLMISGFHVNTDPMVVCGVLACVYLIQTRRFAWAGSAFGLALSLKLTGLLFVPALAIAAGARKSVIIGATALMCFCVLSLPYLAEFPDVIGASVLNYAGPYYYWGIPGITLLLGPQSVYFWYRGPGKFVTLGAVAAAAFWFRYKARSDDLLCACGLSAALFLVLTPGFGVQYLAYLVPWLAAARFSTGIIFYATAGTFMFTLYTWGANGFPWYLANFFATHYMPVPLFFLGLMTWLALCFVAVQFVGLAARASGPGGPARSFGAVRS